MKSIILLAVLIFSGCATEGKYQEQVKSWVGHSESDLVGAWGIPDSTYAMGDSKLISYNRSAGVTSNIIYGTMYTQAHGCKTTFTINNIGMVERWAYEGNACRAR